VAFFRPLCYTFHILTTEGKAMPDKIYLICSAEDYSRPCHRFRGAADPPPTENGCKQIERLAGRAAPLDIDVVYSSPQRRAIAVAEALTSVRKTGGVTRIKVLESLSGRALGRWEWRPYGENTSQLSESDIVETKLPGSESDSALVKRVTSVLQQVFGREDKTIAIVADAEIIRELLICLGCVIENLRLMPCSLSTLEYSGGKLISAETGDDRHITGDIITPCYPPHLRYRPAATEDELRIAAEFWRSSWYAVYGNLDRFSFYGAQSEIQRIYEENSGAVILAMLGNAAVGTAVLDTENRQEPGCGHITLFVFSEQFRGLGLAPQLMGEAEDFYAKLGRKRLRLFVSATNARALAFYRKNGFEITSAEATVRDCTYVMQRQIVQTGI
jgi:broad specificity phosphatase PhoE